MQRAYEKKKLRNRAGCLCIGILCLTLLYSVSASALRAPTAGCSPKRKITKISYVFPLETSAWRISDSYGWREDPFTGEETFHKGVDLACASGAIVLAGADGMVITARRNQSYGNYLRLFHENGEELLYAHMQYLYVRAGEVVKAGQPLGTVGQTGRTTGAHLHLEWKIDGTNYDPTEVFDLS